MRRISHQSKTISDRNSITVAIVGGGPAGLTAAYQLQKIDPRYEPIVFEAGKIVGGIARTESKNGFRFDIGGHRFFTKVDEVDAIWHEILDSEFIRVSRLSRIYYRGKYYDYPLKIFNALFNIGLIEAFMIMVSYGKVQIFPRKQEESFEDWVINRFGRRLYQHFFESYTQKVWGISPKVIRADWAAQRIKNLSLLKTVVNALGITKNDTTSLIDEFDYPRLGPGMMWEKMTECIENHGGQVRLENSVTSINHDGKSVQSVQVRQYSDGELSSEKTVAAEHFINSMALDDLIGAMKPAPPKAVQDAAAQLNYRDFLIVTLVLDHPDPFPDNWIYVHSPDVRVGRIQNFRAWSKDMIPDENFSSIGMEYFCQEGDDIWAKSDEELGSFAADELDKLNLASKTCVVDHAIIRQRKAYPVYDADYKEALKVISDWLSNLENFQTVGRNGMHRYNNQDHSMLTAMLAAHNIHGENHDLWSVNVERAYHEDFQIEETAVDDG